MVNVADLKEEAKKLLKNQKVKYVIGFSQNGESWKAVPAFIKSAEDADNLVWDPTCTHNLARFLVDEKRRKAREKTPDTRPVAVVVKGCDSRAVIVLLQEKFINREDVVLLGVSCEKAGVVDEKKLTRKLKGKIPRKVEFGGDETFRISVDGAEVEIPARDILADRCLECKVNFPLISDVFLGEKMKRQIEARFSSLEKMEALTQKEKWAHWKGQFEKCIRCYACRSVCPMCYCDECVADSINLAVTAETSAEEKAQRIKWLEKSPEKSENFVYHLVRAIHLAGRCIDCGECERSCPVDIPIRLLNTKLEKDALDLFAYEAGMDAESPSLVSSFRDEDPEDFIR